MRALPNPTLTCAPVSIPVQQLNCTLSYKNHALGADRLMTASKSRCLGLERAPGERMARVGAGVCHWPWRWCDVPGVVQCCTAVRYYWSGDGLARALLPFLALDC